MGKISPGHVEVNVFTWNDYMEIVQGFILGLRVVFYVLFFYAKSCPGLFLVSLKEKGHFKKL